ncbi:MAG: hypothetical protein ACMUHU_02965 [Thermoplasmatota archaeon]
MVQGKLEEIAEGLEGTIGTIDEELAKLGKRGTNSTLHGKLLISRGRALRDLAMISENKEELLGYAIGSETEAVNIFNRKLLDHESAKAHYELALTYIAMSEVKDHERNVDIAIRALDEAKEFINYDDDPELYTKIDDTLKKVWKNL